VAKRGTPGWRGYATAVALTATVVLLCVAINSLVDGPPILIGITQAVIAGGTLLVLIFVALALFAIRRDFAGRELAEAELDRFFSLSFDFLTIANADGYFKRVSPASQELLGWTPEELTNKPWLAFVHPDDVESTILEAEKLKAGQRVLSFENRYRHKDGSWRVLAWRSTPEGDRFYGIARDVTDETRIKQELRDAKEQLEARVAERTRELEQANTALQHAFDDLRQSQQQVMQQDDALQAARTELARVSRLTTLGELTTSIAHEVSQPLGGIVASAGACARWLAADPPAMKEAQAALANIIADGIRAREVIARIRALSKRQAPRMDWLDINQEIMGVLTLTERELRSQAIVLRTELRPALPRVAGDRVQLQQVLINLILNAIEAMSAVEDRARELTIVSGQDAADAVVIEVRDCGHGLDPQQAEHVFQAFYTTKPDGIGIGLSISRSIIEAHGGRLWASGNAPHGAVFQFSLPADGARAVTS
jgi:PAS domain S-box-containing protein